MGIKVGDIQLDSRVVLAPMSGVTDLPFRRLVRRRWAGLVVSEMIASDAVLRAVREEVAKMATDGAEEFPMAVQLAGWDPVMMAEAARINVDRGAAIIDINMGCPAKKVVNKFCGSALMRDEPLAARIIEAVVAAVDVPVSLKMRTGWDETDRNAPRLARIAEDAGVAMITVHGRTRAQKYEGRADWAFIREVKRAVSLPVVANGDVASIEDAERCLAVSGADAVMIGRGACGRPWLLGQVGDWLAHRRRTPDPCFEERGAVMREHVDAMLSHYGRQQGLRMARKHVGWYASGLEGAAAFRGVVNNTMDEDVVFDAIDRFFGADRRQDADGAATSDSLREAA